MPFKSAAEMFGDGGGFGPAVPYSTSNPPGTSAGNRGIQFGEQLTAAIANRTSYALAENTDDLNTRLSVFETGGLDAAYEAGNLIDVEAADGGVEIVNVTDATDNLYLGRSVAGAGDALKVKLDDPAATGTGVNVDHGGSSGTGVSVQMLNAATSSPGLVVEHSGTAVGADGVLVEQLDATAGAGVHVDVQDSGATGEGIWIEHAGTGSLARGIKAEVSGGTGVEIINTGASGTVRGLRAQLDRGTGVDIAAGLPAGPAVLGANVVVSSPGSIGVSVVNASTAGTGVGVLTSFDTTGIVSAVISNGVSPPSAPAVMARVDDPTAISDTLDIRNLGNGFSINSQDPALSPSPTTTFSVTKGGIVGANSYSYLSPVSRTILLSPYRFSGETFTPNAADPERGWLGSGGAGIFSQRDQAALWCDLAGILRSGCGITSIDCVVNPGSARALSTDRFKLFLYSSTNLVGGQTLLGQETDDGSGSYQTFTLTPGVIVDLDFASYSYYLFILAGDDGGGHSPDAFYGVSINYTDPGPRNH